MNASSALNRALSFLFSARDRPPGSVPSVVRSLSPALSAGGVDRRCFWSVSRAAIAKWVGWLGKVQGVIGGGARASVTEIRWRWRVEVEEFVDEIDWRGRPFLWGISEGVERMGVIHMYC